MKKQLDKLKLVAILENSWKDEPTHPDADKLADEIIAAQEDADESEIAQENADMKAKIEKYEGKAKVRKEKVNYVVNRNPSEDTIEVDEALEGDALQESVQTLLRKKHGLDKVSDIVLDGITAPEKTTKKKRQTKE